MADLRLLKTDYNRNQRAAFEDLAIMLFCTELGLTHGVIRSINQYQFICEPVIIDLRMYALQAKYYIDSVDYLDLERSIITIKDWIPGITDLYLFVNKDFPVEETSYRKHSSFVKIEEDAVESGITLHWWTKTKIESILETPKFAFIKSIYFDSRNKYEPDYSAFYEYVYHEVSSNQSLDGLSLLESYFEPSIKINGVVKNAQEYLESFVDSKNSIAVISGVAGQGKTSLCRMSICDFYKNGWLASKVKNIFLFPLLNSGEDYSVSDNCSIDIIFNYVNSLNVSPNRFSVDDCKDALVFLDGFDEIYSNNSHPWSDLKFFIEEIVIPFQNATRAHVIITSRLMENISLKENIVLNDGRSVPILRIQPMTLEQQATWIKKYNSLCNIELQMTESQLEEYIRDYNHAMSNIDAQTISGNPLMLRIYMYLRFIPWNMQSLGQTMDTLIELVLEKTDKDGRIREFSEELAYHKYIDDKTMDILKTEVPWIYIDYSKTGLICDFTHRAFYEYFFACWILKELSGIKNSKSRIINLNKSKINHRVLSIINELYNPITCNISQNTRKFLLGKINDSHLLNKEIYMCNILSIFTCTKYPFKSSMLSKDSLKKTDLSGANLQNADLSLMDLSQSNLRGANLSNAIIESSTFAEADLTDVLLHNAKLVNSDFRAVSLLRAIIVDAEIKKTNLSLANLSEADFSASRLNETDFSNADLTRADFSNALLEESNLSGANLENTIFKKAKLAGLILKDQRLNDIRIINSDQSGVQYNNLVFENADFSNTKFVGSKFSKTAFLNSDLSLADFSEAEFEDVTFENTDLSAANFSGTILRDTRFKNNNLYWTDFSNADLRGISLSTKDYSWIRDTGSMYSETKINQNTAELLDSQGADLSRAIIE